MTIEDSVTFARLIDFSRMVVVIVAQWTMIHSPPNVLQDEPQWSPVILRQTMRQTMSTEPYILEWGYGIGTTQVMPLRRNRDELEVGTSQVPETQTKTVTIPPLTTTLTAETTQPWKNTVRMRTGAIHTFTLSTVRSRRTSDLSEDSEEEDPEEDMEDDDSEDLDKYIVHEPVRSTLGHPSWGQRNRD